MRRWEDKGEIRHLGMLSTLNQVSSYFPKDGRENRERLGQDPFEIRKYQSLTSERAQHPSWVLHFPLRTLTMPANPSTIFLLLLYPFSLLICTIPKYPLDLQTKICTEQLSLTQSQGSMSPPPPSLLLYFPTLWQTCFC